MEELIATARNIRLFVNNKDPNAPVTPEIEMVLTTVEKSLQFVGSALANIEQTKTIRFIVNPEGARSFAKSLEEWATEAEDKADEINELSKKDV